MPRSARRARRLSTGLNGAEADWAMGLVLLCRGQIPRSQGGPLAGRRPFPKRGVFAFPVWVLEPREGLDPSGAPPYLREHYHPIAAPQASAVSADRGAGAGFPNRVDPVTGAGVLTPIVTSDTRHQSPFPRIPA